MSSVGFVLFGGIMSIQIMIGGIRFQFDSDFEIRVEKSLTSFLCIEEETADIKIKMSFSESEAVKEGVKVIKDAFTGAVDTLSKKK